MRQTTSAQASSTHPHTSTAPSTRAHPGPAQLVANVVPEVLAVPWYRLVLLLPPRHALQALWPLPAALAALPAAAAAAAVCDGDIRVLQVQLAVLALSNQKLAALLQPWLGRARLQRATGSPWACGSRHAGRHLHQFHSTLIQLGSVVLDCFNSHKCTRSPAQRSDSPGGRAQDRQPAPAPPLLPPLPVAAAAPAATCCIAAAVVVSAALPRGVCRLAARCVAAKPLHWPLVARLLRCCWRCCSRGNTHRDSCSVCWQPARPLWLPCEAPLQACCQRLMLSIGSRRLLICRCVAAFACRHAGDART